MLHVSLVIWQLNMVSEHPKQVDRVSAIILQSCIVSLTIEQYTPQVIKVDPHPHNELQVVFVLPIVPHPPN
jgi:hypothetical protein